VININYQSFFEQILLQTKGYTIEYSTRKKKRKMNRQEEIEKKFSRRNR
jgi:hypothetical protein